MHFGTYMGIYWILKFILFPLGFHIPFLSLLFVILTLSVPFIGYHYAKMYRDKICGEYPIFACHALHYIYVYVCFPIGSCGPLRLFPVHRSRFYRQLLHPAMGRVDDQHPGFDRKQRSYKETIDTARSLTSINITMQLLSWDVFWGSIPAIPTALMVMKKAKPENDGPVQS